jgi:dephospho-CoA kinase
MHRIGLTGNIASGKSTVARVWQELGAEVVDADVLARRAVEPGTPAYAAIVAEWGPGVLRADGSLDRVALRDAVFRDPAARRQLEKIVHPAVSQLRDQEFTASEAAGRPIVVADIPLLFEVGMEGEFDVVVLVDAPEDLRMRRLVEQRGIDPDEARRMIAVQMPSGLKRGRADIVIENADSLPALEERARRVWRRLEEGARKEASRG